MEGILILDKPSGITSHDACDRVKHILKLNKVGHAGTLDPMVTGVLVIALESSTKALRLFNGLNKTYVGKGHLHEDVPLEKLKKTIEKNFIGKIMQTPPKRSRVKREEREREIFEFRILKKEGKNFEFIVSCQAGTYIRKLIDDLGKAMNIGSHMTFLHRTNQGPFSDNESIKIEELENKDKLSKSLLTLNEAIKRLGVETIEVNDSQELMIRQGKMIDFNPSDFKTAPAVAINKQRVIALMEQRENKLKPDRVI
jgi:H/ACA ribonucleoprotein complex subunit 4